MHDKTLEREDRRLLQVIQEAMDGAKVRAGAHLACRPGCTECCHGPFPINALDARRLQAGLDLLARRDPERAETVAARARAQLPVLRAGFPGDRVSGLLDDDEDADEYFSRHAALPCPVLDLETGRCDLYAHRPLPCRTFGPPVRFGVVDLPPCRLCFTGASPEEIDACRVEPDPHGVEDRLLDRFSDDDEDTLIAFALGTGRRIAI